MFHALSLACELLGLTVAAGLQPVLLLLLLALMVHCGELSYPASFAALGSPTAILGLGGLVLLQLLQRRWGLRPLISVLRFPLALAAGALVFVGVLGSGGHGDPSLLLAVGAVAAGVVHVARSTFHRLDGLPFVSGFAWWAVGPVEALLALLLAVMALLAPLAVPVLLVLMIGLGLWVAIQVTRRFGREIFRHYAPSLMPYLARVFHLTPPPTSHRAGTTGDWLDGALGPSAQARTETPWEPHSTGTTSADSRDWLASVL